MKILNDGVTFFENPPTIQTNSDGNILIVDDSNFPINGLTKDTAVSIYIVQSNKTNSSSIIYYNTGTPGATFTIPSQDGYITFCHIILPNEDYYKSHSEEFTYWANKDGLIFKGENTPVDVQEIVEVNDSTLIRHIHNFFSVYHLRQCFVNLSQQLFNQKGFNNNCFNSKVDSQLRYKRDLVWAALNVIQYMIDSNQLAEAQRLLERIGGCNGLCSNLTESDCGCSK